MIINPNEIVTREELEERINFDLKWDNIMVYVSLGLFIASFFSKQWSWIVGAACNYLIWVNGALITKRNKQMMGVLK